LVIAGLAVAWIGQYWLGDTLSFWADQLASMDSDIWFKAQYQASFPPAILTALGYISFGLGLLFLGTYREKKGGISDIIDVVVQIVGLLIILVCLWIIVMRIIGILSL
jgi:hypothetical protein